MSDPLTLIIHATAFAAGKHRNQRRKDAQASAYINQIEYAPYLSRRATPVKLADKICNLRDMNTAPRADWRLECTQENFGWARGVIDGLRGTDAVLEGLFDTEYIRRPRAG